MLKRKKYTGFTLVEMLIVMGILSILMAIGVSVARFAIQRANNIQHQSAADQMFQALQSHYTDKRHYPPLGADINDDFVDFDTVLDDAGPGALAKYVDASFDGGSPTRFWYIVDPTEQYPQAFLVCVSYSDPDIPLNDPEHQGAYCTGNGFGEVPATNTFLVDKTYEDQEWNTAFTGATVVVGTNAADDVWGDGDWE